MTGTGGTFSGGTGGDVSETYSASTLHELRMRMQATEIKLADMNVAVCWRLHQLERAMWPPLDDVNIGDNVTSTYSEQANEETKDAIRQADAEPRVDEQYAEELEAELARAKEHGIQMDTERVAWKRWLEDAEAKIADLKAKLADVRKENVAGTADMVYPECSKPDSTSALLACIKKIKGQEQRVEELEAELTDTNEALEHVGESRDYLWGQVHGFRLALAEAKQERDDWKKAQRRAAKWIHDDKRDWAIADAARMVEAAWWDDRAGWEEERVEKCFVAIAKALGTGDTPSVPECITGEMPVLEDREETR